MDIQRQDLHLLVVLDVLLECRSVTRAAQSLHLSQPAMSNAVRRLREWVGDPLLVRSARGYVPTPRAEELRTPVRRILEDIEAAVARPQGFDPATAERTFRIAANDAFELAVLPALVLHLRDAAPGVKLAVTPLGGAPPFEALDAGEVDFGWGTYADIPAGLHRRTMFRERLCGLAPRGLRGMTAAPSMERYAKGPHVFLDLRGSQLPQAIEARLAKAGLKLQASVVVEHLATAAALVAQAGCLATVPSRIARQQAAMRKLRVFELPFTLPAYDVCLLWHERTHRDAGGIWMRELLASLCQQV